MDIKSLDHAMNSSVGIVTYAFAVPLLTNLRVWRRLGEDRNRWALQSYAVGGTATLLLALLLAIAGGADSFLVVILLTSKLGILTSVISPPKKRTERNAPSSSV